MTTTTIVSWFCLNILLTFGCYLLWSYCNHMLFTYLGEAEITPGNWEMCYMYDTLTVPARVVAFLGGVLAILVFVVSWAAFIGLVFF